LPDISRVADRVWTGGDMPSHRGVAAMLEALADLRAAGITHIIDNRLEWSDEDFVRQHAPEMTYLWNGQDDAGQAMPDEWFERGVGTALGALAQEDTAVLAHCHAGINRGPSMAFAILLATGASPVRALTAIRRARPVAAIAYSLDALDWWQRVDGTPRRTAERQRAAVVAWHRRHSVGLMRILRRSPESSDLAGDW
jgi:dual specificity phosphatase 3